MSGFAPSSWLFSIRKPVSCIFAVGVSMSSFIQLMIMGTPTITRRPSVAAQLLPIALLGLGVVLSSSIDSVSRVASLSLLLSGCGLLLWRDAMLRAALARSQSGDQAWQALVAGSQDAITVLKPQHDLTGRFKDHVVTQANARAHALFADLAVAPFVGQPLQHWLPAAQHASIHHRLQAASQTQQPQFEEHVLHAGDAKHAPRWVHHQIIPLPDGVALISRDTTDAHLSMQAARDKEAFYRTLVDCLPMAVYARSTRPSSAGEYVVWNKAAAEVMKLAPEQVLGRKAHDLLPPEITRRGDEQDLAVLRDPRVHHFPHLTYNTPAGERIVDLIKVPVRGVDGQVDHILAIARDITDQRQAADQLRLASRVIDETAEAVVVTDAVDRVVMVNPAFLHVTGMSPSEVVGQSAELLGLPPLRESHLPGVSQALKTGQRWTGESRQVCTDGRALDTWLSVSTLRNDRHKVTQHIRIFSDISVLKAHQRELVEQARHDSLTGLPNRRAFGERLNQAMARARRNPQTLAVLFIDLDGFKAVNDRFGHAAGDALLIEVGQRLLQCVRLTDSVCRLAGDEFTVILEGAGHSGELALICQRIVDRLSMPHDMGTAAVVVSPSIGAAVFEAGDTADALSQRADGAMYAAKHAGKARFVLSEPHPAVVGSPSAGSSAPLLRAGAN
jgi:diguanylate cyclase (GGDEF)-like protein/PAS domain S-box-containing protein